MTIKRRLEKLEEKAGVRRTITLEMLVGAANGDANCVRRLEEAEDNDHLCRLIIETARGAR